FAASKSLAPLKKVTAIKGLYPKRDRMDTQNKDLSRAPGESYKVANPAKNSMVPYMTTDKGLIVPVPFEEVHGYGPTDLFNEKANAAYEAMNNIEAAHAIAVKIKIWAANEA